MHFLPLIALGLIIAGACPAMITADDGTGLMGTYYDNIALQPPGVTRLDPTVNFNWTSGPIIAGVSPSGEMFSARWSGAVEAQFSEQYTFYVTSDDGVILTVNGQVLVDNWTDHGATQNSGVITLVAGQKYDLLLEYYNHLGPGVAILAWSSTSTPKAVIPSTALFPTNSHEVLAISTPVASRTSPAWVEGTCADDAQLHATVGGTNLPLIRESDHTWFALGAGASSPLGIYLSPSTSRHVVLSQLSGGGTQTVAQDITWTVTDLGNLPYGLTVLDVRVGDQLLITANGKGTVLAIDTNFNGTIFTPTLTGAPGTTFIVPFTATGTRSIHAQIDGHDVGKLTVNSVSVQLTAPIACEIDFTRTMSVPVLPANAVTDINFTANDPMHMNVTTVPSATAGSAAVQVKPVSRGRLYLQARLPSGAVITAIPLDQYTIVSDLIDGFLVSPPDANGLSYGIFGFTMSPPLRYTTIHVQFYVSDATVNGLSAFDVPATQLDASGHWSAPMTISGGLHVCHKLFVNQP
jgi:hypothetical protein